MKVLRASRRVPPCLGGQEIHVAELTRHLARLGVDQHLVFEEGDAATALEGAAAIGIALRGSRLPSNILRDALFGRRLAWYAKGNPADVVHTHGDAPVARGGSDAAEAIGAVHVHTFHAGLITSRVKQTVLRTFLPKQSCYLVVAPQIAKQLEDSGVSPQRIWVRPSGVREEFFRPRRIRRESVVAVGGRLVPLRRVLHVVEQWIAEPRDGITLAVFGAGPEADEIQRLAAAHDSVEWHGQLGADDLAKLLRRAAAGIVLSRADLSEGTPTLALEMMAAGCAPIVSEGTGVAPRLIKDLSFGAVASTVPSPAEVAQVVEKHSGSTIGGKRRAVHQYIREHHSWDAIAGAVAAFYERLLRRDPAAL